MTIDDVKEYLKECIDKCDTEMARVESVTGISNHRYISLHGARWAYRHILQVIVKKQIFGCENEK